MGVDKLSYGKPTAMQCTILITIKVLIKSVVFTILALFVCANIHNFYYNTPLVDFDNMKLHFSISLKKYYNSKTCRV